MIDVQLMGLLNATLQAATLLFIAALGELITEKSGILNLGVEGMISFTPNKTFVIAGKRMQKAPPKNPEAKSSKIYIWELFIEVFM